MILLSLDAETSGLNFAEDRIIEVGAILYSTGQRKCLDNQGYLVQSDVPVSAEITKITGITQAALDKFGYEQEEAFDLFNYMVEQADAIIGHNVLRFDKFMFEAWARRLSRAIPDKLWIDTMIDLPGVEGKKLSYLAADHGFLNMFPHSALSDAQTVLTIVEKYDINLVVERAKTPTVIVKAHTSFGENEAVKKAKFRWAPAPRKFWWKAVKECDLEELSNSVSFDFSVEKDLHIEDLDGR